MAHEKNHDYHIIDPSPWPLLGAFGGFTMLAGSVIMFKGGTPWIAVIGLGLVLYTMYVWWRDVIAEGNGID
ncbi:MAG: cytochrome c oxidase subunit 3, partial [Pseudomonadota bacterium]